MTAVAPQTAMTEDSIVRRRRRIWVEVGGKVVLAVVGAAVVLQSLRMGIGSLAAPGPGLWPGVAGAALLGFSAYLLAFERGAEPEPFTANSWKVPVALLSLAVFGVALAYLGLMGPVVVLMVVWLKFLGGEPLWLSVVLACAASVALHLLFVKALGVPFPRDVLLVVTGLEGA